MSLSKKQRIGAPVLCYDEWRCVAKFMPFRQATKAAYTCKLLLRACSDEHTEFVKLPDINVYFRSKTDTEALRTVARACIHVTFATHQSICIGMLVSFLSIDKKTILCNHIDKDCKAASLQVARLPTAGGAIQWLFKPAENRN